MKAKKLTKKDWIIFICFVVGSLSGIAYSNYLQQDMKAFHPKPLSDDEIKQLSNSDTKVVFIYPLFSQYAYQKNGFYDYYDHKCNTCNVVSIKNPIINATYNTGKTGFDVLTKLGYPFVTDIMVDQHPEILNYYNKVILLHNEYMTKKEFDAVANHKNVVYLYPNAMYVEVAVDYNSMKMSLVRGHGYPDPKIGNGFGYVTTSQFEYDVACKNITWKEKPNGISLSCYPELLLLYDRTPIQTLKDYPNKVPNLIPLNSTTRDLSNIKYCDYYGCNMSLDSVLNQTK